MSRLTRVVLAVALVHGLGALTAVAQVGIDDVPTLPEHMPPDVFFPLNLQRSPLDVAVDSPVLGDPFGRNLGTLQSVNAAVCSPPSHDWTSAFGGTGWVFAVDVAVDGNGNVIVLGIFQGTIDFDPEGNLATCSDEPPDPACRVSNGGWDIFVTKADSSGAHLWTRAIGGSGNEFSGAIAVDSDDAIYIGGYFQGTVDFNPEGNVKTCSDDPPDPACRSTNGGFDAFATKLSADGGHEWTWRAEGASPISYSSVLAIAVDESNRVVMIAGDWNGTAGQVDFNPDPLIEEIPTHRGDNDIFVTRLNMDVDPMLITDPTYVWTQTIGSPARDNAYGIDVDDKGFILISGNFGVDFFGFYERPMRIDFDPTAGEDVRTAADDGCGDLYVTKLGPDPAGADAYQWTRTFFLDPAGGPRSCAVAPNYLVNFVLDLIIGPRNSVLLTGAFIGTLDFGGDSYSSQKDAGGIDTHDIFVTRLNKGGNVLWTRTIGGDEDDVGWHLALQDVADPAGDDRVLITGVYGSKNLPGYQVDFDPTESGVDIHTNEGFWDTFVTSLALDDGCYGWTRTIGGSGADKSLGITAVEGDPDLIVHVGFFGDTIDFGPPPDPHTASQIDGFVTKLLSTDDGCDCACPNDADCDGILDGSDNCEFVPNPGQQDCNSDGMGDLCDAPAERDADGDGVCNDIDNCPTVFNPGQENDCGGDGAGDACDPDVAVQNCQLDLSVCADPPPAPPPPANACNADMLSNCPVGEPCCNDCNSNGIPDGCDIRDCFDDPACADCQPVGAAGHGIPDGCDIAIGDPDGDGQVSPDINGNGVPDECDPGACCYVSGSNFLCVETDMTDCETTWGGTFLSNQTCPTEGVTVALHHGVVVSHVTNPAQLCGAPARRQGACTVGDPIDPWMTSPDALMCHQFGVGPESPPIPADFFEPGSEPFTGQVCLEGQPLGPTPFGEFGDADTLVRRTVDPFDRCDLPSAALSTIEAEVVALNLSSTAPISVMVNGTPVLWDVAVDLSAVTPEPGWITAVKTHCNGGTYNSELHVQPRFTFSKVNDPPEIRVLDTGLNGDPYITLIQDTNASWTSDVSETLGLASPICTDFHPGIEDTQACAPPACSCDCNTNGERDACDIDTGKSQDCNGNGVPDTCDLGTETSLDCNSNGVPDDCDIASESSTDCNRNGVPDECDPDCNDDGTSDGCDSDCQPNGVSDVCEILDGTLPDCNGNGVPDGCDIIYGELDDCNGNGVPDECEATEACCAPDGSCVMTLGECCVSELGGTPQGPGSTCGGMEACCDATTGACDTADRTCCLGSGDIPQGPGTVCTTPEACCFADDTCQMLDPLCCVSQGGVPQGPGSTCGGMEACCDTTTGACYTADRTCCLANGDTPHGPGSTCGGMEACCDATTGACDMADRTCCLASGDIPQGPGTVCTAPEACCFADDTCEMLDPLCCVNQGGTPEGVGSTCGGIEACCLSDDTCVMADALCCVNRLGGAPQGPGSQCRGMEACCLEDDLICFIADALCCENIYDGEAQGAGTTCLDSDGDGAADCVDQCNGIDDALFAPECEGAIPAVSDWGVIIMILLLLTGAKAYFRRRPSAIVNCG